MTSSGRTTIPLIAKLLFTAFMALWVPTSWQAYGPTNFLYLCNVALFLTLIGLWTEHPLLIGMAAVGAIIPQGLWIADFLSHFIGTPMVGTTNYMFEEMNPLLNRFLALFHIWLPFLLVWLVLRCGYDRRAPIAWTALATAILIVCYFWMPAAAVDPADPNRPYNINFAHGLRGKQERIPALAWLAFVMIVPQLLWVLPVHFAPCPFSEVVGLGDRRVFLCVPALADVSLGD